MERHTALQGQRLQRRVPSSLLVWLLLQGILSPWSLMARPPPRITNKLLQVRQLVSPTAPPAVAPGGRQLMEWESLRGRRLALVGTCHVSVADADKVRAIVRERQPDSVVLEIDALRLPRLNTTLEELGDLAVIPPPPESLHGDKLAAWDPRNLAIAALSPLIRTALTKAYDSMTARNMVAGGEFAAAIEEGRKQGSRLVLADIDSTVTIESFLRNVATGSLNPLQIISKYNDIIIDEFDKLGVHQGGKVTPKMLDDAKALLADNPAMFVRLKKELPQFYNAFIGSRDAALASAIASEEEAGSSTIVAVVGIGHTMGIQERLAALQWKLVAQS